MARPLRIQFPGAVYHIMSRGNEKKPIFIDDSDRNKFIEILQDYHTRFGIIIHCYVLMKNHYHLVMETPLGNLVKVMQGINGGYTVYFNRKHQRIGHLFQGRYNAILIDKDSYLLEVSRYVHLNPVRGEIVKTPELFRWSSYPGFINKSRELSWIEYSEILKYFTPNKEKARRQYRDFVLEGITGEINDPFENTYGRVILGSNEFVEKVQQSLNNQTLDTDITESKSFVSYFDPASLISTVSEVFNIDESDITRKGKRNNTPRNLTIYLTKKYSGLSNKEIGRIFGGLSYSAVTKVSTRTEEILKTDKDLNAKLELVMSNVKV